MTKRYSRRTPEGIVYDMPITDVSPEVLLAVSTVPVRAVVHDHRVAKGTLDTAPAGLVEAMLRSGGHEVHRTSGLLTGLGKTGLTLVEEMARRGKVMDYVQSTGEIGHNSGGRPIHPSTVNNAGVYGYKGRSMGMLLPGSGLVPLVMLQAAAEDRDVHLLPGGIDDRLLGEEALAESVDIAGSVAARIGGMTMPRLVAVEFER